MSARYDLYDGTHREYGIIRSLRRLGRSVDHVNSL